MKIFRIAISLVIILFGSSVNANGHAMPGRTKTYFYEPSSVRLVGKLVTQRAAYESFSDSHSREGSEDIFLLELNDPINIKPDPSKKPDPDSADIDVYSNVKELQVAFDPSKLKLDSYKDKNVVVEGYLYESDTGNQKTEVLIFAKRLFTENTEKEKKKE